MMTKTIAAFVILIVTSLAYQNCSPVHFVDDNATAASTGIGDSTDLLNGGDNNNNGGVIPDPTTVDRCSVLSNSSLPECTAQNGGFKGNLYVQPASSLIQGWHGPAPMIPVGVTHVNGYLRSDWKQPVTISLATLAVPSTKFKKGFLIDANNPLKDAKGTVLNEWFALDLHGVFHLDDQDTDGVYQFAMIADDGARVFYGNAPVEANDILIDNQSPLGNMVPDVGKEGIYQAGSQSTVMGCTKTYNYEYLTQFKATDATQLSTLNLTTKSKINLRVLWYQGPREGLSATFLYRKAPAKDPVDAYCGKVVNFQKNTQAYDKIFASGWKVVGAKNLN